MTLWVEGRLPLPNVRGMSTARDRLPCRGFVQDDAGRGCHTNNSESAWSLFKRSVVGAYHQVSKKYLDAYLDEFEWLLNNRKNPYLFRYTMLKLLSSPNLEYKKLTAA